MEDDLSNHRLDFPQILNFRFGEQIKIELKKKPSMEDNLKIFKLDILATAWNEDDLTIVKLEYLSNQCSDLPQILNLSLGDQIWN